MLICLNLNGVIEQSNNSNYIHFLAGHAGACAVICDNLVLLRMGDILLLYKLLTRELF